MSTPNKKQVAISLDTDTHTKAKMILAKQGGNLSQYINTFLAAFVKENDVSQYSPEFNDRVETRMKNTLSMASHHGIDVKPGLLERCIQQTKEADIEEAAAKALEEAQEVTQ